MTDIRTFRANTREFVIKTLTEVSGQKPQKSTVNITVDKIVKALTPVMVSDEDNIVAVGKEP